MTDDEAIEWAEQEIRRLDAQWQEGGGPNARWPAGLASEACEFLRLFAPGSTFLADTEAVMAHGLISPHTLTGVVANLRGWVNFKKAGLIDLRPFELRARQEAATDLMEQVRILLDDAAIHPAAPVMLAGAALEEALRGLVEAHPDAAVPATQKPTINVYATVLQKVGLLTRQQVKDVTAWAGRRNDAAHGNFEAIDVNGARNMADGVNLFLQRLGD